MVVVEIVAVLLIKSNPIAFKPKAATFSIPTVSTISISFIHSIRFLHLPNIWVMQYSDNKFLHPLYQEGTYFPCESNDKKVYQTKIWITLIVIQFGKDFFNNLNTNTLS